MRSRVLFFVAALLQVVVAGPRTARAYIHCPDSLNKQAWVASIDGATLHSKCDGKKTIGRLPYGAKVKLTTCSGRGGNSCFEVTPKGRLKGWISAEFLSDKPVRITPLSKAGAALIARFRNRQPLASLVDPKGLTFVFSGYDRHDGSSRGKRKLDRPESLDKGFTLRVVADGKGWAVPKSKQRRSVAKMSIKLAKTLNWVSEVRLPSFDQRRLSMQVSDPGSESARFFFKRQPDGSLRLSRIEYRIEDPG